MRGADLRLAGVTGGFHSAAPIPSQNGGRGLEGRSQGLIRRDAQGMNPSSRCLNLGTRIAKRLPGRVRGPYLNPVCPACRQIPLIPSVLLEFEVEEQQTRRDVFPSTQKVGGVSILPLESVSRST
jgi:hypothetical protein